MKTKTLSNNRVTRSHSSRQTELPSTRKSAKASADCVSVSKRENSAILRQVNEIRDSWSATERVLRAQLGAQRRAELCQLLFGAN